MQEHEFASTVVVRCKNKQDTIGATLASLREQTVRPEIVVIDSGSTDQTVAIAGKIADVVIRIEPTEFSYGGALNLGAERARGEVVFALSAHCVAPDDGWIGRSLAHYRDPLVGATNGTCWDWEGQPLTRPVTPDLTTLLANPRWGFSNHASSWRRSVWQQHAFREDLAASEDKDWSWRVRADGIGIVFDPSLDVSSLHRRTDGLGAFYDRVHRETYALALLGHPASASAPALIRDWWSDFALPSRHPRLVRRMNPFRAAERLAIYRGTRAGLRARSRP